ncbi:MAG: ComF family protein [Clostridiales bacterium]|nr:ComF family protein [Clostridiales bacterium]
MINPLDLLFPGECVCCAASLKPDSKSPFCPYCHSRWEFEKNRVRNANRGQAVFIYPHKHGIERSGALLYMSDYRTDCSDTATNTLIYKLKYSATNKICDFVASEFAGMLRRSAEILFSGSIRNDDVIVTYIPRRRYAILKYGYDHMERVAKATASKCGFKYEKLLTKTNSADEQKNLNGKERFANAASSTKLTRSDLSGKTIILIDDIVTTGASISSGAELLLSAGASSIIAASIAVSGGKQI